MCKYLGLHDPKCENDVYYSKHSGNIPQKTSRHLKWKLVFYTYLERIWSSTHPQIWKRDSSSKTDDSIESEISPAKLSVHNLWGGGKLIKDLLPKANDIKHNLYPSSPPLYNSLRAAYPPTYGGGQTPPQNSYGGGPGPYSPQQQTFEIPPAAGQNPQAAIAQTLMQLQAQGIQVSDVHVAQG